MAALTDPFAAPFMQRALLEVALLAIPAGLLGAWVVLRRLAFYTHAVGTATFPGLVVAAPWGVPAPLAALAAALLFAGALERLARTRRLAYDAATGLLLVGALALGTLLASDVYHSGAGVDRLLFGTLLGIGDGDLHRSAFVAAVALVATGALGRAWLATGFDPAGAGALGVRASAADRTLLVILAAAVVVALPAVGALLVSALLVIPAATVRLVAPSVRTLQLGSVALAAAEGVAGLWLAYELNAPPGATIALLGGVVFAVVALGRAGWARLAPAGVAGALLLALAGCGTGVGGAPGQLRVVATTTQIADIVAYVAGPDAYVTRLLSPNADPHEYEPRPSDARAVAAAGVVFRSGGDVDGWLDGLVHEAGGDARVVDLSASVSLRRVGGTVDPHWWQDPRNVVAAARRAGEVLAEADTADAAGYRRRAADYERAVRRLDRNVARCLRRVPPAQRKLVTDHDAFGYFAARYGFRVIGTAIPSLSTQGQASAGETAALVRTIRRTHVRAIFSERSVNAALERNVAHEAGASILTSLYADSLGPAGSAGATWLGATAANARAIARGLTGGRARCAL